MKRASIIFIVIVLAAAGLFVGYLSLHRPSAWTFGGAAISSDSTGDTDALAAVKVGDKWGYIDKTGKYAINPQFDNVGEFNEGLARAEVGGKWGYIDKTGKYAINPQFVDARDF